MYFMFKEKYYYNNKFSLIQFDCTNLDFGYN